MNQPNQPSPKDLGALMPVCTNSDLWEFFVIGMGDSPKQVTDENMRPKVFPGTGGFTLTTGTIPRFVSKDGTIRNAKGDSVKVVHALPVYELGEVYAAKGRIWVQPWENKGRVALSITCEELVPVNEPAAAAPARKPAENAA